MKLGAILLLTLLLPVPAAAAPAKAEKSEGTIAFRPEVLGAKAFLEDLLARRYAQDLATVVDRQSFQLGARIDLVEAPKEKPPEAKDDQKAVDETPADLLLGMLDPEKLIEKYAGPEAVPAVAHGFLKDYRIKSVAMTVGLREELGADAKTQVEKWLADRLGAEFGKSGAGAVNLLRLPAEKPKPKVEAPNKTPWDWLDQFQHLAGQLVLALAILLGTLLWKLLGSGAVNSAGGEETTQTVKLAGGAAAAGAGAGSKGAEGESKRQIIEDQTEQAHIEKELRALGRRITGLMPKMPKDLEPILRSWSLGGESGRLKIACLAEVAGLDLGRLPIPVDALNDLTKTFAKMPDVKPSEKREALNKAYWDLLMSANLGPSALEAPFGYLASMNVGMVNQILMDQNPKMKALVALHMPSELRESYMKSLEEGVKRELIGTVAQMSEIAIDELNSFDSLLKGRLGGGQKKSTIPLDAGLIKLVGSLSPLDEVSLLNGLRGGAYEPLKRQVPSIGFIDQWTDAALGRLLGKVMPDELAAYVRLRPDQQERMIGLSPAMTAEVAADELRRPDQMNAAEKSRLVGQFAARLKQLVEGKEISLEDAFPAAPAPGEADDGLQKSA